MTERLVKNKTEIYYMQRFIKNSSGFFIIFINQTFDKV